MRLERIWRCDCGDNHFLAVTRYPDDPEGHLSLVDGTHCTSLWCRLKAAWSVIRHGRGYGHWGVEIVLNPVTARELITELEEQWPAPQVHVPFSHGPDCKDPDCKGDCPPW